MAAVQLALGVELSNINIVRSAGSVSAGGVLVEYDNTDKQLDVIVALEACIDQVREDFHDAP